MISWIMAVMAPYRSTTPIDPVNVVVSFYTYVYSGGWLAYVQVRWTPVATDTHVTNTLLFSSVNDITQAVPVRTGLVPSTGIAQDFNPRGVGVTLYYWLQQINNAGATSEAVAATPAPLTFAGF